MKSNQQSIAYLLSSVLAILSIKDLSLIENCSITENENSQCPSLYLARMTKTLNLTKQIIQWLKSSVQRNFVPPQSALPLKPISQLFEDQLKFNHTQRLLKSRSRPPTFIKGNLSSAHRLRRLNSNQSRQLLRF